MVESMNGLLSDAAVVQRVLDLGVDIHHVDHEGDTALIDAVREGHLKIAEALLARGANVGQQNLKKDTALAIAEREGWDQLVELLRSYGAQ